MSRKGSQCGLPETSTLPDGWTAKIDPSNNRVYYILGIQTTFDHPTFGALPKPWQLRIEGTGQQAREYYYNTVTRNRTAKNPRFGKKELETRLMTVPRELREAATITKNSTGLLQKMRRPPLSHVNNRHRYEIVHTIDSGDINNGGIGAMNGGVFVVRVKGAPKTKLDVEKRFTLKSLKPEIDGSNNVGVVEILITRRLIHPALANVIDAFIAPDLQNPKEASLYLEFCDRGSLGDLIKHYAKRINTREHAWVPERFVWHAFVGLCDALSYLWGGRSFATDKHARRDPRALSNWAPILHRDLKPDNILIRSRSTISSTKYPYLVISDFGLSTEDILNDPYQLRGTMMGSSTYLAPELLYNPAPVHKDQINFLPKGKCHTFSSDFFALGACIYNLCRPYRDEVHDPDFLCSAAQHLNWTTYDTVPQFQLWAMGTVSRKRVLDIGYKYSDVLCKMILKATEWDPQQRGAAHQTAPLLVDAAKMAGFIGRDPSLEEMLPDWSSRVHSYNAK